MLSPLTVGLAATSVGSLLVTLVVLALIVLVGRLVLRLAWWLLSLAIVVVAILYVVSLLV